MIEISNEELVKVLNLWTGTDEWYEKGMYLYWDDMCQRRSDGSTVLPCDIDKEAHALVNFMLKERKYPTGGGVFFPVRDGEAAEQYVEWVKDWERRFGNMSQEELCIPPSEQDVDYCEASEQPVIDHSIPVRYDHLISTEELVKRAKERWPDDGWDIIDSAIRVDGWTFGSGGDVIENREYGLDFVEHRTNLLTLIDEVRSERTTPEILDELEECRKEICEPSLTKAERFYAFLATPQPDISLGLWGITTSLEIPMRDTDSLGWLRENVRPITEGAGWTGEDFKGEACRNIELDTVRNFKAKVVVEV